jgi:hypothetical protein
MLVTPSGDESLGPDVGRRQSVNEHSKLARAASEALVFGEKSSRIRLFLIIDIPFYFKWLRYIENILHRINH